MLATKVYFPMGPGPNDGGLSRKHVLAAIDASLRRLGTDYVDLYQIHRWDYETPVEETMEALHDVVKAGKARYIGASSMFAWQFAKAQHVAERHGWTRFVSMQNHYNLLYREEEREMLPLCADQGVAVLPYSPLARGMLAGNRSRAGRAPHRPGRGRPAVGRAVQRRRRLRRRGPAGGGRGGAGRSPGPGRAGLAAEPSGRDRADRRRHPARPHLRRAGRAELDPHRRGGGPPRGALRPAPGARPQLAPGIACQA